VRIFAWRDYLKTKRVDDEFSLNIGIGLVTLRATLRFLRVDTPKMGVCAWFSFYITFVFEVTVINPCDMLSLLQRNMQTAMTFKRHCSPQDPEGSQTFFVVLSKYVLLSMWI